MSATVLFAILFTVLFTPLFARTCVRRQPDDRDA